jgi:hypothetical protein
MRRALLVSVVGIGLACGGGDGAPGDAETPVEPVEGEENRPPYVEAISIVPAQPTADDALSVGLRVLDPEHDDLSIELTWYRNGAVHDDSGRQTIDPGEFARDDRIWVEAVISDGSEEITAKTEPVSIANATPQPSAIRITPPEPTAADILDVEVAGEDADGDPVQWSYRWLVDGEVLEGARSPRLAAGALRRGARVAVEVSGTDGIESGDWTKSDELVVGNAAPRFTTQPVYGLASPGRYVYEVKAEDADQDQPLRYDLAEGPSGLSIDSVSGVVTWLLPPDAKGSYPIEIGVSDAHGGRAVQRWALEVSWQPEPETAAKPQPAAEESAGAEDAEVDASEADAAETDEADPGSEEAELRSDETELESDETEEAPASGSETGEEDDDEFEGEDF